MTLYLAKPRIPSSSILFVCVCVCARARARAHIHTHTHAQAPIFLDSTTHFFKLSDFYISEIWACLPLDGVEESMF